MTAVDDGFDEANQRVPELAGGDADVEIAFKLPAGPAQVLLDAQMFRRVLLNLIQNATQALEGDGRQRKIRISLRAESDFFVLDVDDSGTSGGFESRILIDPAAESGPPLETLTGRWSVRDGLALTAIVL